MPDVPAEPLSQVVARAQQGDRAALEDVVRAVQPDVYRLAMRFLWHPQDAEDATQDILVRVVTRLSTFRGESAFRTWVYRVAANALLDARQGRVERHAVSLDAFAADLAEGLSDAPPARQPDVEEALLLEEVKIGCTLAMLLCLDRAHRLAYILGEILELDHREAAAILEIRPAAFRKRVSRARSDITGLMRARCGLFDPRNACRCRRRVDTAIRLGRVDPDHLLFASPSEQVRAFPQVLHHIRGLEEARRSAALYRSHPTPEARSDFAAVMRALLE
jgi:RNA polymerase sigma factor (sigma-70 family)